MEQCVSDETISLQMSTQWRSSYSQKDLKIRLLAHSFFFLLSFLLAAGEYTAATGAQNLSEESEKGCHPGTWPSTRSSPTWQSKVYRILAEEGLEDPETLDVSLDFPRSRLFPCLQSLPASWSLHRECTHQHQD